MQLATKVIAQGTIYRDLVDKILWERVIEPILLNEYRPPYFMNIHLSNKGCSLRCSFCVNGSEKVEEILIHDHEKFKLILQKLVDLSSKDKKYRIEEFHFDGDSSDPLLPKTIDSLVYAINFLKDHGRKVEIITNGMHLCNKKFLNVVHKVDLLNVSLNATTAKEHFQITSVEGAFGKIMEGLEAVHEVLEEHKAKTRIHIFHVLVKMKNGKPNIRELKRMIKKLEPLGVSKYLFRINMFETDDLFIGSTTEKITKIMRSCQKKNSVEIAIKPFKTKDKSFYQDSCVAYKVWETLLPDGSFSGCPHNMHKATAIDPSSQNVPKPYDLAMICERNCPSFLSAINERWHEVRQQYFFEIKYDHNYSPLLSRLHPHRQGKIRKSGITLEKSFDILHAIPYDSTQTPLSLQRVSTDPVLATKKKAFIVNDHNGVVAWQAGRAVRPGAIEYFFQDDTLDWDDAYVLKRYPHEITLAGKISDAFLFDEVGRPVFNRQNKKDLPRYYFPNEVKNGIALMKYMANKAEKEGICLVPISENLLATMNDLLHRGHIYIDQDSIRDFFVRFAMELRGLLEDFDHPELDNKQEEWPMHKTFEGTLLDYNYFLRYFGQPAVELKDNIWISATNKFDIYMVNYLFFLSSLLKQDINFTLDNSAGFHDDLFNHHPMLAGELIWLNGVVGQLDEKKLPPLRYNMINRVMLDPRSDLVERYHSYIIESYCDRNDIETISFDEKSGSEWLDRDIKKTTGAYRYFDKLKKYLGLRKL